MRTLAALCALVVHVVDAHGSGAWKDLHHYDPASPGGFAGMRYVSEGPPHHLVMVGSDDGLTWWSVTGWCSGADMTSIHFDFSSKGGPANAVAKWVKAADDSVALEWGDGNKWEMMAPTADSKKVKAPKPCCNCACAENTEQCGHSCSFCDCVGCCSDAQ